MSGHDLYLVLRERLETVAEGFHIGKDVLDEAQDARGYSHERMARELNISEKTWRRWKAKGAVPADRIEDVARVLRLDIEAPRRQIRVPGGDGEPHATEDAILAKLDEALQRLARLEQAVAASRDAQSS